MLLWGFGIPNANLGDPFTSGLGEFDFNGNNGGNSDAFGDGLGVARCNCPLIESEQQFQVVTNWTKTRGNHIFKFGADVRYAENLRVPSDANQQVCTTSPMAILRTAVRAAWLWLVFSWETPGA